MSESEGSNFHEVRYDFTWDDTDAEVVGEAAKQYIDEYNSGGSWTGIPIAFLDNGTFKFRVWPDRDKNGKARVIKRTFIHRLQKPKTVCVYDDRIEELVDRVKKAEGERTNAWRMSAQEIGYMMVHMFECPESDFYAPGMDVCLVLRSKEIAAMNNFLMELKPNERGELLDPNNEAPLLSMSRTGSKGKLNVSIGLAGTSKYKMPPMMLPDGVEWEGLDKIYITDDQVISDEDFDIFKRAMSERIASAGGPMQDPGDGHSFASSSSVEEESSGESSDSSESSEGGSKCPLQDAMKEDDELAKEFEGSGFGSHPTENNMHCMTCVNEASCMEQTNK